MGAAFTRFDAALLPDEKVAAIARLNSSANPENIIFCIDASAEMKENHFYQEIHSGNRRRESAEHRKISWLDAAKKLISDLVFAKHKIQERHRYGIWQLEESVVKVLDPTQDIARVKSAVNALSCDTAQYRGFDFNQLQAAVASQSCTGPLRIILIYGRQGIPTKPSAEFLSGKSAVCVDGIFLHSTASNPSQSQMVYDAIVSLDRPSCPGYFFEESVNLPRLLSAGIPLLAHPYHRAIQSELNYTIKL